ncbi:MAG: DUF3488 and transglutaminase-like domain-containing protein [Acidiferrobacterales bacterium]|nr:DUF3488 and transglutaminase-like domain-containing protein [Acidiferrobacterales bacterium]
MPSFPFRWRRKSRTDHPVLIESTPGGLRLLFISISLLALTALPHFNHIRLEVMLIFLGLVSYRGLAARYRWLPRNRWIVYVFAAIGFTVAAWFYGPPIGRDPGVAFLVIMLGLKSVEITSRRDVGIVVLLGLFTVMTHFLYADGVNWTLPLLALVIALFWLLAQMEHATPRVFMISDIKLVGKMLLQALPVVIILFYLFPRLSGSLYLFQGTTSSGVTGLGESLKMGTISNLIESEDVAFTASFFDQPPPPASERYWRGNNFWITDGREWTRGGHGTHLIAKDRGQIRQNRYRYEIELEPNNQNWLFSLDYPLEAPDQAWLQGDYHLVSKQPVKKKIRYQLDAVSFTGADQLTEQEMRLALSLGRTQITPRLETLIRSFTEGTSSSVMVANRVLQYFNQNNFIYSLSPPILASQAPVDEFMFDSQKGFCGHYASSFATIMRYAGIPARVVVGYLGGDYNPRSNQIVVRQSDAHAWTEIWQQDRGWIRVDPTAAVAPERIEGSIDISSLGSDGRVLFDSNNLIGFKRLYIETIWIKDAIKAKWNRWFINFDSGRQKELLKSLGLDKFEFKYVFMLAFLVAISLLSLLSAWLFRSEREKIDPVSKIISRFDNKMRKLGVARNPNEGPRDFQLRASKALPHLENQLAEITDTLVFLRYNPEVENMQPGNHGSSKDSQLALIKSKINQLKAKQNPRSA